MTYRAAIVNDVWPAIRSWFKVCGSVDAPLAERDAAIKTLEKELEGLVKLGVRLGLEAAAKLDLVERTEADGRIYLRPAAPYLLAISPASVLKGE